MSNINYIAEPTRTGAVFRPATLENLRGGNDRAGVLAIDPGLYLGWAFKNDEYITAGFEDLSQQKKLYGATEEFLERLMNELCPEYAVVEKYFAMGHALENRTVEQRGAIKAVFERNDCPWTEIHPATVRKCLGIKGKPSDVQIRESVSAYFDIPTQYLPDPNGKRKKYFRPDVFDALALIMAEEN